MHHSGVRLVRGSNTVLEVIPPVKTPTIEQWHPRANRRRYALRLSTPPQQTDERKAERNPGEKVTTIHLNDLDAEGDRTRVAFANKVKTTTVDSGTRSFRYSSHRNFYDFT